MGIRQLKSWVRHIHQSSDENGHFTVSKLLGGRPNILGVNKKQQNLSYYLNMMLNPVFININH